jgi:hypothetical protein
MLGWLAAAGHVHMPAIAVLQTWEAATCAFSRVRLSRMSAFDLHFGM